MMENIASIIGAVSGLISLIGIIYLVGYWKGGVDSRLKAHEDQLRKYPPGETALMCKTMWDIYVVDALRQHPELAQHSSSFKLTKQGIDLVPEPIKKILDELEYNPTSNKDIASGWLVVKHLGISAIEQMSREKSLTVQEAIAILSTYLDAHRDNCMPR